MWRVLLVTGVGLLALALRSSPTRTVVVDVVVTDYREDAPGRRRIAALEARLLLARGQRWIELVVAAQGTRIAPVPGLGGLHGANTRTARELHGLLRDDRLSLAVRDAAGRTAGAGRVVGVVRGRLPERRLDADGDVDLEARTAAVWPVEVTLVSDALPERHARFDVLVDGVCRLSVTVEGERISAIESLGEPELPLVRRPRAATRVARAGR